MTKKCCGSTSTVYTIDTGTAISGFEARREKRVDKENWWIHNVKIELDLCKDVRVGEFGHDIVYHLERDRTLKYRILERDEKRMGTQSVVTLQIRGQTDADIASTERKLDEAISRLMKRHSTIEDARFRMRSEKKEKRTEYEEWVGISQRN